MSGGGDTPQQTQNVAILLYMDGQNPVYVAGKVEEDDMCTIYVNTGNNVWAFDDNGKCIGTRGTLNSSTIATLQPKLEAAGYTISEMGGNLKPDWKTGYELPDWETYQKIS